MMRDKQLKCIHCQKSIVDNQWFCRFPEKPEAAAEIEMTKLNLCSPTCTLRYFDTINPDTNGNDHEINGGEHRLHFFLQGEEQCFEA